MALVQMLFGFSGRIGRAPYFGFGLLAIFVCMVSILSEVYGFSTGGDATLGGLLLLAGAVGSIWTGLALTVKRLHDMGLSGLHAVWIFGLSVVGSVVGEVSDGVELACLVASLGAGLWLIFAAGEPHANEFGRAPGSDAAHATARAIAA